MGPVLAVATRPSIYVGFYCSNPKLVPFDRKLVFFARIRCSLLLYESHFPQVYFVCSATFKVSLRKTGLMLYAESKFHVYIWLYEWWRVVRSTFPNLQIKSNSSYVEMFNFDNKKCYSINMLGAAEPIIEKEIILPPQTQQRHTLLFSEQTYQCKVHNLIKSIMHYRCNNSCWVGDNASITQILKLLPFSSWRQFF
jgi:hypothetical protein